MGGTACKDGMDGGVVGGARVGEGWAVLMKGGMAGVGVDLGGVVVLCTCVHVHPSCLAINLGTDGAAYSPMQQYGAYSNEVAPFNLQGDEQHSKDVC